MNLEVGMYVRTQFGIDKVKDIILNGNLYEDSGLYLEKGKIILSKKAIKELKVSYNIIDLIEDEDIAVIEYYVSKYRQRITRMFECSLFKSKEDEFVIFENKHCDWWYDKNKKEWEKSKGYNPKIKSIVTKEQFESIKYSLEG